jgi:hypothetical protein
MIGLLKPPVTVIRRAGNLTTSSVLVMRTDENRLSDKTNNLHPF